MSERNNEAKVKDSQRRKFLAAGIAGAAVVASVAGYTLLRLPDGSYTTRTTQTTESTMTSQTTQSPATNPTDPSFDANGVQLPLLTSDPPHRQGSIYFRSDLSQLRLDDGTAYYTLPKKQVLSKGVVVQSPVPQKFVMWRAPFACTVTAVKGYQDVGTGSVVTAYDGSTNLLATNLVISSAASWQDGGSLAKSAISAGDSIEIMIVSVSGSPNYISIQVELTQP